MELACLKNQVPYGNGLAEATLKTMGEIKQRSSVVNTQNRPSFKIELVHLTANEEIRLSFTYQGSGD